MPTSKPVCSAEPLPRYIMPDESEPEYAAILEQLEQYRNSQVGMSYYYIRAGENTNVLCRIIPGGKNVFFHEIVNHHQHGISDEDIEESVMRDTGAFTLPGHFHISPHIEKKLRSLLEFE
jgi:hypothetical protein